jgi:uncharacterized protein (DUF934 family)
VLPERLIRGEPPRVEKETWRLVERELAADLPAGKLLVPLARWRSEREALAARIEPTGVWLEADEDPAVLGHDVFVLPHVAVSFPRFGDGRGFSTAVLLRRLGYRGELRAFGDIGRDHLFALRRCGFDAYSLPAQRDPEAALAAFTEFSLSYQGAVDDPVPLFRRRAATHG